MGQAVQLAMQSTDGVQLAGVWSRGESLNDVVADADVLIDFSLPAATAEVLAVATKRRLPLVCGVSGLESAQMEAMRAAALRTPILFDRNMSQGIAVLSELAWHAARSLGAGFRTAIHEVHHVHKIDAPSGTALQLGGRIALALSTDGSADSIEYTYERRGEVPGDHAITFRSPSETLTLSHSVSDRSVFARGALRAARWVISQPPGLYCMRDVLFPGDE